MKDSLVGLECPQVGSGGPQSVVCRGQSPLCAVDPWIPGMEFAGATAQFLEFAGLGFFDQELPRAGSGLRKGRSLGESAFPSCARHPKSPLSIST